MVGVPRSSPAELAPGWPETESPDIAAEAARLIALALRDAVAQHGLRGFAGKVGLNHSTLLGVIEGRTWPSIQLVARMEDALGRPVWPSRGTGDA